MPIYDILQVQHKGKQRLLFHFILNIFQNDAVLIQVMYKRTGQQIFSCVKLVKGYI